MKNGNELASIQLEMHRAFIDLWREIPYSQLRVNKICQGTPVARSTFYTYYEDLAELRAEVEDRLIAGLVAKNRPLFQIAVHQLGETGFLASTLEYVEEERSVFEAFLIYQVNVSFIEKWNQATKHQLRRLVQAQPENQEIKLDIFAAGVVAVISHYLKKPANSVNIQDLDRLAFKVLD